MNIYYVYMYLRNKTSKNGQKYSPYYIGKGKGNRYKVSHGKLPVPKDAEYIRFVLTELTEDESLQVEIGLIKLYGRLDLATGILRNRTDGGEGLSGRSQESRDLQSKHLKEYWASPSVRLEQSNRIKQVHINNPELRYQKANYGSDNGMYGKHHTEDVKIAQSKRAKGNMSKTGQKHSESTILLLKYRAQNRKTIPCIHCSREFQGSNYKRWHGDNCKLRVLHEG